jgi:hypothetical protein
MLTLLTRESVGGVANAGSIVLNTDYMSKLRAYETTKCRFKFHYHPEDRRGGYDTYVVSETLAVVKADMDTAYNAISIQLNCYPDNDRTKTAVATVFPVKELIQAYPDPVDTSDRDFCIIEVNEKGFKARKYLAAHYFVDVASIAATGTSSTTTSTTSTTSTSTTSTSTTSTTTT